MKFKIKTWLTSGLETLILTLLDDVVIDTEKMTFPDFLIFVSRRKWGNGVLKLFDEYDKGELTIGTVSKE